MYTLHIYNNHMYRTMYMYCAYNQLLQEAYMNHCMYIVRAVLRLPTRKIHTFSTPPPYCTLGETG